MGRKAFTVEIDSKACIGCGACQAACPRHLIRKDEAGNFFFRVSFEIILHSLICTAEPQFDRAEDCLKCSCCTAACVADAISFSFRELPETNDQ